MVRVVRGFARIRFGGGLPCRTAHGTTRYEAGRGVPAGEPGFGRPQQRLHPQLRLQERHAHRVHPHPRPELRRFAGGAERGSNPQRGLRHPFAGAQDPGLRRGLDGADEQRVRECDQAGHAGQGPDPVLPAIRFRRDRLRLGIPGVVGPGEFRHLAEGTSRRSAPRIPGLGGDRMVERCGPGECASLRGLVLHHGLWPDRAAVYVRPSGQQDEPGRGLRHPEIETGPGAAALRCLHRLQIARLRRHHRGKNAGPQPRRTQRVELQRPHHHRAENQVRLRQRLWRRRLVGRAVGHFRQPVVAAGRRRPGPDLRICLRRVLDRQPERQLEQRLQLEHQLFTQRQHRLLRPVLDQQPRDHRQLRKIGVRSRRVRPACRGIGRRAGLDGRRRRDRSAMGPA